MHLISQYGFIFSILRNFDALQHDHTTSYSTKMTTSQIINQNINRTTAIACLILSMSLVGSYVALSKPLTLVLPVLLLAWLRFGIGGLAMLHWLKKPKHEPVMSSQTKRLVFIESLLGNFLFSICMLYGVSMTSAVNAGIIMAMIPAVVALMSWMLLGERISLRIWMAIALGVSGIALYTLSNSEHFRQYIRRLDVDLILDFLSLNSNKNAALNAAQNATTSTSTISTSTWLGNLLLVGAVLCEAAYAVIGKKLTTALSPKRISALINAWGFALMTPLGVYVAWQFNFHSVSISNWLLLVFYALAASVWSVWLWMTGLKVILASAAGVYTVFLPIAAALIGVLVLGENLNNIQMIGFALALLGVVLATLPTRESVRGFAPSPSN
jgi:drug/metabolite transporter (DMT)-like permease